jgi:hypothetical protein
MRTLVRVIVSVIAGFFLMWPLGEVYGLLNWPTFHSWGLLHGGFFAAWPTLSVMAFLALGYLPFFGRSRDTPLFLVGLAWGLVLRGFLGVASYMSHPAILGLLVATAAIVTIVGFFTPRRLALGLLVLLPILANQAYFLAASFIDFSDGFWLVGLRFAFDDIKLPLLFVAIGWALASIAARVLKRPPPAVTV